MHWFATRGKATRALVGLGLILLIFSLSKIISGCTDEGGHTSSGFPQPQIRQSSQNRLSTTLQVQITTSTIVDSTTGQPAVIQGPAYEGTFPGPTLIVQPGDTLNIDLVNNLPANPPSHRGGAFHHFEPYTTNLHTHGLTVSPQGISDNVLREMAPGGTHNPVSVHIPSAHPSGTFWYHPHKHGAVTFQFLGGTAGMLIIKGGAGTLDAVPAVQAAEDVVMVFQVLRTLANGQVAFINPDAAQFGSNTGKTDGLWSAYLGTALGAGTPDSKVYYVTNGVTNPTLRMRPGQVQRWRLLNASTGENLLVALQDHSLHVLANDGITVPTMLTLPPGAPYTMGAGQRADVLVQAGAPGTYRLESLAILNTPAAVSPQGIAPAVRRAHISADFPVPNDSQAVTLATVIVEGAPVRMALPSGPLPVPTGLPSVATMLNTRPNAVRQVFFDLCGERAVQPLPETRLSSCAPYSARYNATYWGGEPFTSLLMFRDGDDNTFAKEGLFNEDVPLFNGMVAGNFETWTVTNRSFSDHPFHIHQNPFLVTKINGIPLPVPEWHDTFLVPAAVFGSSPQSTIPPIPPNPPNIAHPCTAPGNPPDCVTYGSIEFVTHFDPISVGTFVMHCHILQHEDIGMMQRVDIQPAP